MGSGNMDEPRDRFEFLAGLMAYVNAIRKEQEEMAEEDLVASWIERDLEVIERL